MVLNTSTGTDGNSLHVKPLNQDGAEWAPIVDGFTHHSSVVEHVNGKLYMLTDIDAPRYRLVAVDPADPSNMALWSDVLPESEDLLESVSVVGGNFGRLPHRSNRVMRCDLDGNARVVNLPSEVGSVGGFGGKWTPKTCTTPSRPSRSRRRFTNWTSPQGNPLVEHARGRFHPSSLRPPRWYTSKDGTRVPMFIVHKKGLAMDGTNPTLLYAYGGFNISLTPSSAPATSRSWGGGIYAMPNLRGGGGLGSLAQGGHALGQTKRVRRLLCRGDYLVEQGYTSHDKLAIAGGNNGGLLVGAIMTQRPTLPAWHCLQWGSWTCSATTSSQSVGVGSLSTGAPTVPRPTLTTSTAIPQCTTFEKG